MITKNELSSLNLSPTKKDFVQIWNELLEVASKITERWDPTSTNESDPGIVLLKVLAGIADKLNYNIDKNILEAFMPTAAQMESMRKLCELVGYDIKYYQSASTKVRVSYTGSTTDEDEMLPTTGLPLPKFTTITNADKDITYVTTNTVPVYLTNTTPWAEVPCIEGQVSQCESINDSNLITLAQLDDNNRYYLPEIQIAENGIFVYNATSTDGIYEDGTPWQQVSNLNTRSTETRVFKFSYDSFEGRPYLAFPDDIGSLIGDGLFIYFVRTSGLNGNISPRTLEVIEVPTDAAWKDYSAEQFEVVNEDATTNGANIESISAAYNNFKKTVGTFDTLVTCRDYMNKIYSLMNASNSPYVSNILVTDIRNDINKAITLCSCNEFGILYKETPLTKTDMVKGKATMMTKQLEVDPYNVNDQLVYRLSLNTVPTEFETEAEVPLIDHFDLLLYPFKTFTQVSSGTTDLVGPYNKSFTYTEQMNKEIEASLAEFKTCAHNLTTPAEGDLVAINNYLRLNALIATSNKVSEVEAQSILHNIKVALVNEFNLRNLDFGEEIPFDSILSVIENADSRIKVVSLQEPTVLTTYSVKELDGDTITSKEYGIASTDMGENDRIDHDDVMYDDELIGTPKANIAKNIYNKLVLRNILAGRASLLDYDETFIPNNSEKPYTVTKNITTELQVALALPDTDAKKILAKAVQAAMSEIVDKRIELDKPVEGDYVLSNSTGSITGFYNGTLALRVLGLKTPETGGDTSATLDTEPEPETETETETEPSENESTETDGATAEASETTVDPNSPATIAMESSTEGDSTTSETNGVQTKSTETAATIEAYEYELYETYEPSFNVNNSSETVTAGNARSMSMRTGDTTNASNSNIINDISRIEAICEITGSDTGLFENIKLAKNEVIKFRAPNLITTQTFPAYVYYRFEKASNSSSTVSGADGNTEGRYATAISLASFINSVGPLSFFTGLWGTVGVNKLKIFNYENKPGAIDQTNQLTSIFNSAIAVGDSTRTQIWTNENEFRSYLATLTSAKTFYYYPLNNNTMGTWSAYVHTKKTLPKNTSTFWRLSSTSNYPKGRLVTEAGQRLFAQSGDYLQNNRVGDVTYICTDLGEDPKFNSVAENSDVELGKGDKLYIHYTPSSTNEAGETVDAEPVSIVYEGGNTDDPIILKPSGFTLAPSEDVNKQGTSWKKTDVDFKGEKKNLLALAPNEQIEMRSISKIVLSTPARFYKNFDNIELEMGNINKVIHYELKDGEYLFYTDQNTQEAAYYGSGSVITLDKGAYIPKATEHIEVSQILEKGLHIVPWSSYVLLNTDKKITVTEYQYVTLVEGDTLNTMTIDLAQSGSKSISSKQWTKCNQEYPVTYTAAGAETSTTLPTMILNPESGPSTAWEVCSFLELSTSPGYAQQLRAVASATAEDPGTGEAPGTEGGGTEGGGTEGGGTGEGPGEESGEGTGGSPSSAYAAIMDKINVYSKDGTGEKLAYSIMPQKTDLPGGTVVYEPVSVKLNTIVQSASGNFEKVEKESNSTTNATDKAKARVQMKVFKEEAPSIVELDSFDDAITPISNKNFRSDKANVVSVNNYWSKISLDSEMRRPVTIEVPVTDENGNPKLNEDGEPILTLQQVEKPNALNLNFMIPEDLDLFGIFSIYVETTEDRLDISGSMPKANSRIFIDVPSEFGHYSNVISIYNYTGQLKDENGDPILGDDKKPILVPWWPEGLDENTPHRLYLRAGLNCIKVTKSCSLLIKAEADASGNVLYDNLRLVKGRETNGVNLKLLDPDKTFNTEAARIALIAAKKEQTAQDVLELETFEATKKAFANTILRHVTELDKNHDFYYNVPIENSLALEFDDNINAFSNPYVLYDINNVNNSFVVSKLDINYLETGLRIAKSSKY